MVAARGTALGGRWLVDLCGVANGHHPPDWVARRWAQTVHLSASGSFSRAQPKGLGDVNRSHIAVYFDRVPDAKCASSGVGFQPGRDLHRLELDGAGSGDWSTVRGPVAINLVQPDYWVDDLGLCGIFILRLIGLTEPRLAGNICFYLSVLYNYR